MGNNNSVIRKSQRKSTKTVPTNTPPESDDDDDGDIHRHNIQLQNETYGCLSRQTESEMIKSVANSCKTDHRGYIPVEDLFKNIDKKASLQILPEAIRHESVLEFIKIHEKLVVRIRTSVRGENVKENIKENEKKNVFSFATGYVYLSSDKLMKTGTCRLGNCKYNDGQIHENYGGLVVYTNKHVIGNNEEADCSNVDFFYYNDQSLAHVDVMTEGGSSLSESGATGNSLAQADIGEQPDVDNCWLDDNDNINSSANDGVIAMTNMDICQVGRGNCVCSSVKADHEIMGHEIRDHVIMGHEKRDHGIMNHIIRDHEIRDHEITSSGSLPLFSHGCVNFPSEVDARELGQNEESHNNNDYNGQFMNTPSSGLHRSITAYGLCLREDQANKDLAVLRIFYHDPGLFDLIKRFSTLRMIAWSKIPEEIKRKMRKYVIIISHPHGLPKRISIGDLISLEEISSSQQGIKMTTYNATTCGGSSGAPVVTGHYSYRPFVHMGLLKGTSFGASFSY